MSDLWKNALSIKTGKSQTTLLLCQIYGKIPLRTRRFLLGSEKCVYLTLIISQLTSAQNHHMYYLQSICVNNMWSFVLIRYLLCLKPGGRFPYV